MLFVSPLLLLVMHYYFADTCMFESRPSYARVYIQHPLHMCTHKMKDGPCLDS